MDLKNALHYNWGEKCDGSHLVENDSLSVIRERMPPQTKEQKHYHVKAQQFFFILSGVASFELENETVEIEEGQGIHIKPGVKHRISNSKETDLEFLVISQPKSHGDRINVQF